MDEITQGNFILRHVAENVNYIIDLKDREEKYKEPLCINDMGAEIFALIQKGNTKGEMIQLLSNEYQVEESIILQDLNDFLGQLEEFGLKI